MWRNWSFSLIAILMAKNSGKLLTQMGCGTSSTFSPIPTSSDYLQLTCHCQGISHLVSTNILELKLSDQLLGQGPLIWSDLLQSWPAPEKPLSHTEIYPISLSLICFLWHRCKDSYTEAQTGLQTLLQARHLCQASWQISEARTYWKYALAHMWQRHNVHRASTWFRAEHKSTGDPSIHDWFWQNQEIPLMLRDINHLHSL